MLPIIAIVGRPNVGKSTLFNCLTKSKDALVVDLPGTTRDRIYGEGKVGDNPYIVIDTGGLGFEDDNIELLTANQSWEAINESDLVLFVVDAQAGLLGKDASIAKELRKIHTNVIVVVNKIDSLVEQTCSAEFYELGFEMIVTISATLKRGIKNLANKFLDHIKEIQVNKKDSKPTEENHSKEIEDKKDRKDINDYVKENKNIKTVLDKTNKNLGIKIAIVGKPNVGKSTLVNRILGEERVVAYDAPGTTRDSIYISLEHKDNKFTIIDTAGVRKRAKVKEIVEKFSIVKTLRAIEDSNVVVLVIDARSGICDQDLSLLKFILDAGKSIIITINKWDGLTKERKKEIKKEIDLKLGFVEYAILHNISALYGTGVGDVLDLVQMAYNCATKKHSTNKLTQILQELTQKLAPPMSHGGRIKLRFAHAGGHNPPIIVIHGNQTDKIPDSYKRYLTNGFRKILKIKGSPVQIVFKSGENPFKGRANVLTPRQMKKRKRLLTHVKKKTKKKRKK